MMTEATVIELRKSLADAAAEALEAQVAEDTQAAEKQAMTSARRVMGQVLRGSMFGLEHCEWTCPVEGDHSTVKVTVGELTLLCGKGLDGRDIAGLLRPCSVCGKEQLLASPPLTSLAMLGAALAYDQCNHAPADSEPATPEPPDLPAEVDSLGKWEDRARDIALEVARGVVDEYDQMR